ncbi:MAG: FtsQ-type POTRA domain-containing protein [Anaerolineales bacterium]|nr:FtsQ-type POTRA domain-containing protein [Anaerolineales bacterium]
MLEITDRFLKTITKSRPTQRRTRSIKNPLKSDRTTKKRLQHKTMNNSVPVMVRGDVIGMSSPVKRQKKVRRRYNFALNAPGAEVSIPALPRVQFGWRLASGLLIAALSVAIYYLWTLPMFQVDNVEVSGLSRLSARDVYTVMNVSNQPIFTLDENKIEQKIASAFPEFSDVEVKLGLPNVVQVDVVERLPLLKWHQEDKTTLVDANGFAFPERALEEKGPSVVVEALSAPPPIPIGEITEVSMQFLSIDMVSAILSMSAQVPAGATLIYDAQHGLGWQENQGWSVYFGDARDVDMKLNVYKTLLKKLKRKGISPALISVEYVHAPYYRLEQR